MLYVTDRVWDVWDGGWAQLGSGHNPGRWVYPFAMGGCPLNRARSQPQCISHPPASFLWLVCKLFAFQLAYGVIFHSSGAGVHIWERAVTIFCCVWGKNLINTKLKGDLSCRMDLLQKRVSSRPFIIAAALSTHSTRKS